MSDMTESNGNGSNETLRQMMSQVRDSQTRLEAKLDAHIQEESARTAAMSAALAENRLKIELHSNDDHPKKVGELRDAELREEGRKDVLRYIFGASMMGFIAGVLGLVASVWGILTPGK